MHKKNWNYVRLGEKIVQTVVCSLSLNLLVVMVLSCVNALAVYKIY